MLCENFVKFTAAYDFIQRLGWVRVGKSYNYYENVKNACLIRKKNSQITQKNALVIYHYSHSIKLKS